jgi:hypothetical protein
MAGNAAVRVSIQADNSDLRRGTKQAEGDLNRLQRSGQKSLDRLKTAAIGATAALGGGLVLGLMKSVDAAIDAEAAMAKVRKMVENAGISWEKHGDHIDKVIQKQSQLAGLDDEELAESFANMLRTTGDVNKALELNALAADVARSKGIGLAGAQSLLARVYNGSFTGLKKLGIAIEPVTKAQDALKASSGKVTDAQVKAAKATDAVATRQKALAAVQKQFGGQAEAYGKTTAGSIDRAKVAAENLAETIGMSLAPHVRRAAEAASKFINEIQAGTGAGGKFRDRLEEIVDRVRPVAQFFRDHPKLIAVAVGAWAAYKVASLAALAAIKVQTFRKAFAKSVPVAAEQGAAAGVAYAVAFDTTGAAAVGRVSKGGKMTRAMRTFGKGLGVVGAAAMAYEFRHEIEDLLRRSVRDNGEELRNNVNIDERAQDFVNRVRSDAAKQVPAIKAPRGGVPRGVGSRSPKAKASLVRGAPKASLSAVLEDFHDPAGLPSPGRDHYDHVHVAASSHAELEYLMGVAQQFGLKITSTTGGKHAKNSYHYKGLAFDAGDSPPGSDPAAMIAFAKWVRSYSTGGGKRLSVTPKRKPKPKPLVGSIRPIGVGGTPNMALGTVGSTITAGLGSGPGTTVIGKPGGGMYSDGSGEDPNQALIAANDALIAAQNEHNQLVAQLISEIKRAQDYKEHLASTQFGVLKQELSDVFNDLWAGPLLSAFATPWYPGGRMASS